MDAQGGVRTTQGKQPFGQRRGGFDLAALNGGYQRMKEGVDERLRPPGLCQSVDPCPETGIVDPERLADLSEDVAQAVDQAPVDLGAERLRARAVRLETPIMRG